MKLFPLFRTVFVLLALVAASAWATSVVPQTPAQLTALAGAVCRGTVLEVTSFRAATDGGIRTRTLVRVDEMLKGKFPPVVALVHRGGMIGNRGEHDSSSPVFKVGEERLLFLTRRADGTLFAAEGGASAVKLQRPRTMKAAVGGFDEASQQLLQAVRSAPVQTLASGLDVTDQAGPADAARTVVRAGAGGGSGVTGLLADANNIAARYLAPDRGEAIPYLIDAQALPPGITLAQATNAVARAFQAWANVTSLKFTFAGLQNFGRAANSVTNEDAKIRVQLHDLYNAITSGTTLGVGGNAFQNNDPESFPNGGFGGRVGTNEFHFTTQGYVVLNHRNTFMQTLATFEEVLCHEIGHALGMAHSSENPNENNTALKQAIMYYTAHADGRGATLGSYDPPVLQQAHPQANTPPFAFNRVMYAVTSPTPLANPQVNQVEMKGYDLQSTALTKVLCNFTNAQGPTTSFNGAFGLTNNTLTYTPNGAFGDTSPFDPATGSYYDRVYVRFNDGTNMSAPALVSVVQYMLCTKPTGAPDGLPDSWRVANFTNATPTAGVSGANDDPDGDGLTNVQEFLLGTNPNSANSRLQITSFNAVSLQFPARPYFLYELEASNTLTNWTRFNSPVLATTTNATVAGFTPGATNFQFFRLKAVP